MKKLSKQQQGFTLIELLVVIGILAILLAITLIAINPNKHFQDTRNAKRSSDVLAILDGIYEYEAGNTGSTPATLASVSTSSASPSPIASSGAGFVNPCADLVPTYLADLPIDPSTGTKSASTACGGTYASGYTIYKSASSGRFTVAAPSAENSVSISVTR
ncbi:MAG TPA: type II secretion system protein [Candidatus Microsaccharimonas sp.]|nr:type II secretion system protein [Candidatus Microsaccharimonas sp.]